MAELEEAMLPLEMLVLRMAVMWSTQEAPYTMSADRVWVVQAAPALVVTLLAGTPAIGATSVSKYPQHVNALRK